MFSLKKTLIPALFWMQSACINIETRQDTISLKKQEYYELFNVRCVDELVHYDGVENPFFGKDKAFGPPTGRGEKAQSLDVFSLGKGRTAIFRVKDFAFKDKEGIDFKVFENPFQFTDDLNRYWLELATVEVSPDMNIWYGFSPRYDNREDCSNFDNPNPKSNLVGLGVVSTNYIDRPIDPRSTQAGGDSFDLAKSKKITDRRGGSVRMCSDGYDSDGMCIVRMCRDDNPDPLNFKYAEKNHFLVRQRFSLLK